MSAMELFNYRSMNVRVNVIDDEPWFIAKDICDLLGTDTSNLSKLLDDDERGTCTLRTLGGDQAVSTVSESGLYSLILKSRRPEAKAFKRWITREVLPTIRRTGAYVSPELSMNDADVVLDKLIEAASLAREYRNKLAATETELVTAEAKITIDAPKVEAYDTFMDADGKYSVGTVAKILGLGQNKLFTKLRNAGILIGKGHMRNTPYARYMHYFDVAPGTRERSNGDVETVYTTYVQPSGVPFIARKLGITVAEQLTL